MSENNFFLVGFDDERTRALKHLIATNSGSIVNSFTPLINYIVASHDQFDTMSQLVSERGLLALVISQAQLCRFLASPGFLDTTGSSSNSQKLKETFSSPSDLLQTPPFPTSARRISFGEAGGGDLDSHSTTESHSLSVSGVAGKRFCIVGFTDSDVQTLSNAIVLKGGLISPDLTSDTSTVVVPEEQLEYVRDSLIALNIRVNICTDQMVWDLMLNSSLPSFTPVSKNPEATDYFGNAATRNLPLLQKPVFFEENIHKSRDFSQFDKLKLEDVSDSEDELSIPFHIHANVSLNLKSVKKADLEEEQSLRTKWHKLLSSVLNGNILRHKRRALNSVSLHRLPAELNNGIWIGARAFLHGCSIQDEEALVEFERRKTVGMIEDIRNFYFEEAKEESAAAKVNSIIDALHKQIELYPTYHRFGQLEPTFEDPYIQEMLEALYSWQNCWNNQTLQYGVIRKWVGNDELSLVGDNPFIETLSLDIDVRSVFMMKTLPELIDRLYKNIGNAKKFEDYYMIMNLPLPLPHLQKLIVFILELNKLLLERRIKASSSVNNDSSAIVLQKILADTAETIEHSCIAKYEYHRLVKAAPGWTESTFASVEYENLQRELLLQYFHFFEMRLNKPLGMNVHPKQYEIVVKEWEFISRIGLQIAEAEELILTKFVGLIKRLTYRHIQHHLVALESPVPQGWQDKLSNHWYQRVISVLIKRINNLYRFHKLLCLHLQNSLDYMLEQEHFLQNLLVHFQLAGFYKIMPLSLTQPLEYFILAPPHFVEKEKIPLINETLNACLLLDPEESADLDFLIILQNRGRPIPWNGPVLHCYVEAHMLQLPKSINLRVLCSRTTSLLACKQEIELIFDNCAIPVPFPSQAVNLKALETQLIGVEEAIWRTLIVLSDTTPLVLERTQDPELVQNCFTSIMMFGERFAKQSGPKKRIKYELGLFEVINKWIEFITQWNPEDRRIFRWGMPVLEACLRLCNREALLILKDEAFDELQEKVSQCLSVVITHHEKPGESQVRLIKRIENNSDLEHRLFELRQLEARFDENRKRLRLAGRVVDENQQDNEGLLFLTTLKSNISIRWQKLQFLAAGTYGSVYLVVDLDRSSVMTMKEIRFKEPSVIGPLHKRVHNEIRIMEILRQHPSLVEYYGVQMHRDRVYVFLEYCPGCSLKDYVAQGPVTDNGFIKSCTKRILKGLEYMHSKKIVHGDIKTQNIMLDEQEQAKIIDFGSSSCYQDQEEGKSAIETPIPITNANPSYLAPEVLLGGNRNAKMGAEDIWSLGCCVLEMITGKKPWWHLENEWTILYHSLLHCLNINDFLVSTDIPQLPSAERVGVECLDFLKQCFIREPEKRPGASELLEHEYLEESVDSVQ